MKNSTHTYGALAALAMGLTILLGGCDDHAANETTVHGHGHADAAEAEPARGPNGGRMLTDGEFAVELAIFETGVPPEYRAWISHGDEPVPPDAADLHVTLTRLGGVKDEIDFAPQGDFLRGDTVIYEPHSFAVTVEAEYRGERHQWQYDSFEGRTRIGPDVAAAFGLQSEQAGGATIEETITAYGRIFPDPARMSRVSARFDGAISSVEVSVGDVVRRGQVLASVESNESLNTYNVTAPIGGTITERMANAGEQTAGRSLFTILDNSTVWAKIAVFPQNRERARVGMPVTVRSALGEIERSGKISRFEMQTGSTQAVPAVVVLENADGALVSGMYVEAAIQVAVHEVPLAVKRSGLQSFRDFTVVYAKIGDQYEVRMLDLGRQDEEWVEVLGGLAPGTAYVTENSYLVKADIEKSGATHDH